MAVFAKRLKFKLLFKRNRVVRVPKRARVARALMTMQVYAVQMRMKAEMLRDPVWRARVIAGLGGIFALRLWQMRNQKGLSSAPFKSQSESQPKSQFGPSPQSPSRPLRPHTDTRQFRLPPLSRRFYGRAQTDMPRRAAADRPYISPLHRPIEVTPDELLTAPSNPSSSGYSRDSEPAFHDHDKNKPDEPIPP